jgi:hypothetical protein
MPFLGKQVGGYWVGKCVNKRHDGIEKNRSIQKITDIDEERSIQKSTDTGKDQPVYERFYLEKPTT